jgi:orotidine-5'-phosphate decarboxylase
MSHPASSPPRVIVALDYADPSQALALVGRLSPEHCRLKVGKELFTRAGPALVEDLAKAGFDVFLDLKFHDIPNTVARACAAAADLGVWMVNIHALGGRRMMEAAREALAKSTTPRPLLTAVTILTSATAEDLAEVGLSAAPAVHVSRLAALAADCGLDGVVCSARETADLRQARGEDFLLVTPGIRPQGTGADDQRRTATPAEARRSGSDYLVIGRPVTMADDPMRVLLTVTSEISYT